MEESSTIHLHAKLGEIDEALQKAERLNELLREAGSLAGELAMKLPLSMSVQKDVKITPAMLEDLSNHSRWLRRKRALDCC